jgi:hypothetical protein
VRAAVERDGRARVVAVDATPAVDEDRALLLESFVHAVQNVGFALRSVVDALAMERPTGPLFDVYVGHLREPADRLARTMRRIGRCISPPRPALERTAVEEVVAHARTRVVEWAQPSVVAVAADGMVVAADVELLAEAVAAMLESGGEGTEPSLAVDRAVAGGASFARIAVVRRASPQEEEGVAAAWDLAGGLRLDARLRLMAGRAAVLAHRGDVFAEVARRGWVRLGLRVPLTDG